VVSAQYEEVFGILDFVCEKEANRLQALFSTIHVVSKEQIVGLRRESTIFEESQQVVILSVNVACERGKQNARKPSNGSENPVNARRALE
jgi:hypothetical protein